MTWVRVAVAIVVAGIALGLLARAALGPDGRRSVGSPGVAASKSAAAVGGGAAAGGGAVARDGATVAGGGAGAAGAERSRAERLTISVSGDILIHSPVWQRALANGGDGERYDFAPMFAALRRPVADADFAICHLETPVTSAPPSGFPIFNAPLDLIDGVRKAGWDACDTASNHSLDQGQAGIEETVAALRRAGLAQTGSFVSARHARRPVVVDVAGGFKLGLVAYTDQTNGIPPPAPWSVALLPAAASAAEKVAQVRRDVGRAVAAGADAVLVSIQWGDENSTAPNESQLALAREIVAIPEVLAIAGQGPHVAQPIRRVGGKFVIFSSGNLLSNQSAAAGLPAATQYGLVALLRVEVRETHDGEGDGGDGDGGEGGEPGERRRQVTVRRVDYLPTWVRLGDYLVEPVAWGLRNDPANAEALRAAWQSAVAIAGRGARIAPLPRHLP